MIPSDASRYSGGREDRRAACSYALVGAGGEPSSIGDGDAEVTEAGVGVGPVFVEHLDADTFHDAERVLTLGVWPGGRLTLSMLGRRHESFAQALAEARDEARVAGLLAHGLSSPVVYSGALLSAGGGSAARLLVYATHLTAITPGEDPFQVPFGALRSVAFDEDAWTVTLKAGLDTHVFGRLGRQTHPFRSLVKTAADAQARRLAEVAGTPGFADGLGVPLADLQDGERLLAGWTAPERAAGVGTLLSLGDRARARLGLVELLDPDSEALASPQPLPKNVAAFLLVPSKGRVALEVLSGPSAATYVFSGDLEQVNRDLQALHFRRRPLALTAEEAEGRAGRPYRLALRRLAPLQRLREATLARVVHAESWEEKLKEVF